MLSCKRLRIDPGDGSPVLEYRIEDSRVESRTLETDWQELSPDEISSHVIANTTVAQWLRRRIGLHNACTPEFPRSNRHQNSTEHMAA
jgi:hypothetical protein